MLTFALSSPMKKISDVNNTFTDNQMIRSSVFEKLILLMSVTKKGDFSYLTLPDQSTIENAHARMHANLVSDTVSDVSCFI